MAGAGDARGEACSDDNAKEQYCFPSPVGYPSKIFNRPVLWTRCSVNWNPHIPNSTDRGDEPELPRLVGSGGARFQSHIVSFIEKLGSYVF